MASNRLSAHGRSLNHSIKQRKILIFGAGAVGGIVGWRLSQNPGIRVSVICRSNYKTVKAQGFHLSTDRWGSGSFLPHSIYQNPVDVREGPFDYILCTNKVGPRTDGLYDGLQGAINDKTTIVSLQNGIGVEAPLDQMFPNNTIISGVIYLSCQQPRPGVIEQDGGIRPYLAGLALYQNDRRNHHGANGFEETQLSDLVRLGAGDLRQLDDLLVQRWSKQLWNGAFNTLCAITGLDTHKLLRSEGGLVARVMAETYSVAKAAGAIIDPAVPQKLIDTTWSNVPIIPSMLQDVRSRRIMEIESLNGNIWRLGVRLGVDVAELKNIYRELVQINSALLK